MPTREGLTECSADIRMKPMQARRRDIEYFNTGSWTQATATYVTIDEEGVQIHEYDERIDDRDSCEERSEADFEFAELAAATGLPGISNTKVYLADANSTDGTPDIARSYGEWLNIEVIPGGIPSVGTKRRCSTGTLEVRAFHRRGYGTGGSDPDPPIGRNLAKRKNLHCVTTNIFMSGGTAFDRACYTETT